MDSNTQVYRDAIGRFNGGDLAGYVDFYDDSVVFGGVTPEPLDKAGVLAFHEQFLAAFPDPQCEVAELVEVDDRLAARLLLHVKHEGPFMGVEPTGRDAVLAITTLLTLRDGRCVERWSTADMLGLMMQLGAIEAPAA
jgi:predicted ester cyclase